MLPLTGRKAGAATAGYVLVGGRSSRLGIDKALLDWGGRPLAARLAERVATAAGSATLVGDPARYGGLGFPVIGDRVAGFGPLAGLESALAHSTAEWNLVIACDLPNLTPEFLGYLLRRAPGADVLLPVDAAGRDEPLCAVYSNRCHQAVAEAVGRGMHKMTGAFDSLAVRRLAPAEYAAFDPGGRLFANLNTPADLAALRADA